VQSLTLNREIRSICSHDTYEQRLERTRKIRDDMERLLKRCAANADIA